MPSFDTPEPISVAADFDAGTLRLVAHDGHATTTVEIRPANPARDVDVKAAEQTTVDFAHGTLTVKCPKQRRSFRRSGVVEVTIDLPAGSRVVGNTSMGDLIADGTLGDVRFKTSMGDVRVDRTGALHAESSYGAISAEHVAGEAFASTGTGTVDLAAVDGHAVVKNANGATRLGHVRGELRAKASNGEIVVDRADSSVVAKSSNGDVRIGDVGHGSAVLETARGDIEIGIRKGTAAWLDVGSHFGTVHNMLSASDPAAKGDATVEVRAGTALGDITIRRA